MSDNAVQKGHSAGIARFVRGWVVAVLAVILAAGGHQAAHSIMHGGAEPIPLELLAFSAALTAPVAVVLIGNKTSQWSTACTTIFGQLAFHGLYSLPSASTVTQHAGHEHGHMNFAMVSESQAIHASAAADVVMVIAHLLAAVMTTVVIMHGERSLLTIVSWLTLAPIRIVLATLPIIFARPKTVQPWTRVWVPHALNVSQTRSTRGPPLPI